MEKVSKLTRRAAGLVYQGLQGEPQNKNGPEKIPGRVTS
jgi:hypothetical protein